MSLCYDCHRTNRDESLTAAIQQAKARAIESGEAMALYFESGEYKYISASFAIANQYSIITIVSSYQ